MSKAMFWFNIVMIMVYAMFGFFLIINTNLQLLQPKYQTILGGVLILYSLFRLVTFIRKNRSQNE
ncbi:MAG TPA: hypothetical protein PKN75_06870 [Bacteroidia bacterium]|nr:hypothetical protein [Bacteroidia bacterium]HNU33299.1 hypothetical protein [Bacteroidia bacterium]